ncbi:MAG TPA: glycine cleavage system protein GcvH [Candidatus Deferrimicrobiaceae bacterium]
MDDNDVRFSEEHVWVRDMGDCARIGLSDYAQEQLGEIVGFTASATGLLLEAGDPVGEVESQKTVVELPSPVTGTVRAVNTEVVEDPSIINVDPYGKGWLVEIELHDPSEIDHLMTAEEYDEFNED